MADALAAQPTLLHREEEALTLIRNGGFEVAAYELDGLLHPFEHELEDEKTTSLIMWLITEQVLARKAWICKSDDLEMRLEAVRERRQSLEEAGVDANRIRQLLTEVAHLTSRHKEEDNPVNANTKEAR